MRAIEQVCGWALMLTVLADVFLTVLYARIGTGILSQYLAKTVWAVFKSIPLKRHRELLLSFCGPAILVLLVLIWSFLLAIAAGLIVHPEMGSGLRASSGKTPTDLITAIMVGGSSLSIVGSSNFAPQTGGMKLLFLFNSVVGTSVISLTLTYLMQVYSALRERNAIGLKLHALSGETGDAAACLALLFPDGELSGGYNHLADIGAEMCATKEAHHFYPVLFYFRFRQPIYAVSRTTLLCLDMASLIKSGMSDEKAGWLKKSAAVSQLWSVSLLLLSTLEQNYLGGVPSSRETQAIPSERWRTRYLSAIDQLRRADVPIIADEQAGFEAYIALRRCWEPLIGALAPAMAYRLAEIDPAGQY